MVNVYVGNTRCTVELVRESEIQCKLHSLVAGIYPVLVQITNMGYSNSLKYTHDLVIERLSSNEGKQKNPINYEFIPKKALKKLSFCPNPTIRLKKINLM